MAKLVKLTSNIDLDLPASKFDLRSWKVCNETYIYFRFWAFWCIERCKRLKNDHVSEIDLQYWPRRPSFQVWPPILKSVQWNLHLFLILSILVYEHWNRLKNGQVREIDLQYWPWPPRFQVWPPILKSVQWNLHLFFILSILVYWMLESVKRWPSWWNWPPILTSTSQLPSLTSDPKKYAWEPTFIFDSEYFGVLNVEIG